MNNNILSSFTIKAQVVNLFNNTIQSAEITVANKKIFSIKPIPNDNTLPYALPGFIDAHVHIESSMLLPSEFARLAVVHGTVATVSDPHEIANVCGIEGVKFMIENGKKVPFHFCFGAPSCVPATTFETAGALINADEINNLLHWDDIYYLTEMMNFPGVLHHDDEVLKKIDAAKKLNKPIDGHAPGLTGSDAKKYFNAGITTDHECYTYEEGKEKADLGVKILIREGSAAKNFEALIPLIKTHPSQIMFCSDDKHPDSLVEGHINQLVKRAVSKGYNMFDVLKSACILPALHYNIPVGLLRINDSADFILVDNLSEFNIQKTIIKGQVVAENGKSLMSSIPQHPINQFYQYHVDESEIKLHTNFIAAKINVIEALNGQLITNKIVVDALIENNEIISNIQHDILKLVCINRYNKAPPSIAFIKNFGLKVGAIASTVAHDSHNIIAVGTNDEAIVKAINILMECEGGICAIDADDEKVLPLPVAGLMSNKDGYIVAKEYSTIDAFAKALGSLLDAPFMTLSFMALLVIPSLKLSDKGLFDGSKFEFAEIICN